MRPSSGNWNLWNVNCGLDITSGTTFNSRFNMVLQSENGRLPGMAMNFDDSIDDQWLIATSSDGISGFDPAEFTVDTTAFTNNLGGGHFSVAAEGNQVYLTFSPVPEPSTFALLAVAIGCIAFASAGRASR